MQELALNIRNLIPFPWNTDSILFNRLQKLTSRWHSNCVTVCEDSLSDFYSIPYFLRLGLTIKHCLLRYDDCRNMICQILQLYT